MLALIPLLTIKSLVTEHTAADNADHNATLSLVEGLSGWQTALVTVAAVAFVLFLGSYLTGPLFRFISKARLRELFTATALMMVIGIALLMSLVGLSPALGTFLAGVVLANSEYRHELEADIEPFKALLLGLFFITVGASINFVLLFDNLTNVVALTFGLLLFKATVLAVLGYIFKLRPQDRWLMALGLAQAGEFGFVLLSFTVASSVIPSAVADQLMLVIALSMLLTPLLFILYDKVIVKRFIEPEQVMDEITEPGDVIIVGHGRVGGIVNRMLRGAGYNTTVIDYSSAQLDFLRKLGFSIYFGDGTRPDLLNSAGLANAKLLVISIDNKEKITELARYVIKNHPTVHVVARACDRSHVYDLWAVGCRDIIRENYDSSIRMGKSAIKAMGINEQSAQLMAREFEEVDRASMQEVADLHDINIPSTENEAYMKRVGELMEEWESQLRGRMQAHNKNDKGVN